jgi:hypothetical protein
MSGGEKKGNVATEVRRCPSLAFSNSLKAGRMFAPEFACELIATLGKVMNPSSISYRERSGIGYERGCLHFEVKFRT